MKWILVGSHVSGLVSGLYGNQISILDAYHAANPNRWLCRSKAHLYGYIKAIVNQYQYLVLFDNGQQLEWFSNNVHIEVATSPVPPEDIPLPLPCGVDEGQDWAEQDTNPEEDAEKVEYLPEDPETDEIQEEQAVGQ